MGKDSLDNLWKRSQNKEEPLYVFYMGDTWKVVRKTRVGYQLQSLNKGVSALIDQTAKEYVWMRVMRSSW